jgi:hypothetical protein
VRTHSLHAQRPARVKSAGVIECVGISAHTRHAASSALHAMWRGEVRPVKTGRTAPTDAAADIALPSVRLATAALYQSNNCRTLGPTETLSSHTHRLEWSDTTLTQTCAFRGAARRRVCLCERASALGANSDRGTPARTDRTALSSPRVLRLAHLTQRASARWRTVQRAFHGWSSRPEERERVTAQ